MKTKQYLLHGWVWMLILLLAIPPGVNAQQSSSGPALNQGELEQVLAPIALYPDELVSQILMASTYPLEVVQADRFIKQNANLKGDPLTAALEKQDWDPSVKSLVNFPQVLTMMSDKLDWTQKLGDAFLQDQKTVLDAIQTLRAKAQASGNLKTTKEQTVVVEEKIIKIEPANPQVIYVPAYNPTVVYGAWPYPAYPPYAYYPPGYMAGSAFWFAAGVGLGAAWGYAWGNANWRGGDVNINNSQNTNINRNIDRSKYQGGDRGQGGRWQHNPEHRKGVSYRDQGTAQKFNRASTNDAIKSREQFRGRAEQGRQQLGSGQGIGQGAGAGGLGGRAGQQQAGQLGGGNRAATADRGGAGSFGGGSGSRGGAFQGIDRGGSSASSFSNRGASSRQSGGASRGGGGGSRGGGGGGGGRGGGGGGGGGRRR